MTHARRRAGFAQKTKPRRFITEISFADDFQCHGAVQIDVERLVSDPHRTATQLDRFPVFALHQLIMLKSLRCLFRCRLDVYPRRQKTRRTQPRQREPCEACRPDRIPLLQKTHYHKSGRCVWASVFMGLTALRMRSEPRKAHGSPRQSLPDLTPCGRPPLATARCSAFATDGSVF